ncbi:unnamed protein product [Blepharisma stoltei]|uniref:Arginase n=1 Tax=Blepharisma stoltei TaxID=1481888 RepID=A0AAU9J0E3_9CILI|nr:unnamed protein product [Blepharisma stoltei]
MSTPLFKRDDPKLGTIITKGNAGNVCFLGFPYDEGVARNGGRVGTERGPDVLRRFIYNLGPVVNPELEISLQEFSIGDSGNIQGLTLEEAHQELQQQVETILQDPSQPNLFVIGGGKDQGWPDSKGFLTYCHANSFIPVIINIDSHLDVRNLDDEGRIHSGCAFRILLDDPAFAELGGKFIEFGSQGSQCAQSHVDYVNSKGGRIIWLSSIRRKVIAPQSSIRGSLTQAGQVLEELLGEFDEKHRVFISFEVDAINSAFCPGVSCPSVDGGFTAEEAIEVGFVSGKNRKVTLMDMSEYNPAIEDYRTGRLLANIFYYFCLGVKIRTEN